jgi:hypothetical protein
MRQNLRRLPYILAGVWNRFFNILGCSLLGPRSETGYISVCACVYSKPSLIGIEGRSSGLMKQKIALKDKKT